MKFPLCDNTTWYSLYLELTRRELTLALGSGEPADSTLAIHSPVTEDAVGCSFPQLVLYAVPASLLTSRRQSFLCGFVTMPLPAPLAHTPPGRCDQGSGVEARARAEGGNHHAAQYSLSLGFL